MKKLNCVLLLVLLFFIPSRASDLRPPTSDLRVWLAAQTNMQTWSADFVQTRNLKTLTQPLTATGHVWFAAPNRFRWEMRHPAQTTAVRAPSELLVIYPKLKHVEKYPLTGTGTGQWRDALALLEAGFPRTEAELAARYHVVSQMVSNQTCQVRLRPKSAAAARMIPELKIAFDTQSLHLRSTEMQFADGSSMKNDFLNPKLNEKLEEGMFAPEIPADYKVVEPLKRANR